MHKTNKVMYPGTSINDLFDMPLDNCIEKPKKMLCWCFGILKEENRERSYSFISKM